MRALWRLTLTALYAIALTVSGPAHATWSPSISDVMSWVYCLVGTSPCDGLQPGADTVTVVLCGEGTVANAVNTQCVLPASAADAPAADWSMTISDVMSLVYCLVGLSECGGLQPGLDTVGPTSCGEGTWLEPASLICLPADPEPAELADDGDWQVHLGLPCTGDSQCDDGSWCNGAEVCHTPDTLEIEGSFCARKQKDTLSFIEDPSGVPTPLQEDDVAGARIHAWSPPIISEDGAYAYIATAKFIEIVAIDSEPAFALMARIPYPDGQFGHIRMAYAHEEGQDLLYTGWGAGHIARIDVTVPNDPVIEVSTGALPSQLQGAYLTRLAVLNDTIAAIPTRACMSPGCGWVWPGTVAVWQKSDLHFLGSVATDDGHRYDDHPALNEGQFRPIEGVVQIDNPAYRLWPASLHGVATLESPDGEHLILVRPSHSIEIVRIHTSIFDSPTSTWCFGYPDGVCPANPAYQATFSVQYPSFSCFLDNRVQAVDGADYFSTDYKQAVTEASCTALHGTWPDDSGYYQQLPNWMSEIHMTTTTLPSGRTVGVVANGPSGFVVWELDPALDADDPGPPTVRRLVPHPVVGVKANYEFVFLDDRFFCGDSYQGGEWWGGYTCWAVVEPPEAGEDPTDGRLFVAPVGRVSTPWHVHQEIGLAPSISGATHRGLFCGDTNVAILDYDASLYSEACEGHIDEILATFWASPYATQLSVEVFEGHPGDPDFISWRDATDAGPCTAQYKDIAAPATTDPATGEPEPWAVPADMSGLVGVYFPDWGSYPLNNPMDFPDAGYSLFGNWLSGAHVLWKDLDGLNRSHSIRSWYPFIGATGNVAANATGERLYIWPAYADVVGEYAIDFSPAVDPEPQVTWVAEHPIDEVFAGPGGSFTHVGSGHAFAVTGGTFPPHTVDAASVTLYDLDHEGEVLDPITLSFTPSEHVTFPGGHQFIDLREGQGAGGYYYAPLRSWRPNGDHPARYYLLTLDVSADEIKGPDDIAITSLIELDPIDEAGAGGMEHSGELSGYLHISADERLGVFAPHATNGTLVDLAAWEDGVRLPTGFSATPRVVKPLSYAPPPEPAISLGCEPGESRVRPCGINGAGSEDGLCGDDGVWGPWTACVDPDVDLVADGTPYHVAFRHVAYHDSGYWYFRGLHNTPAALAVYRAEIAPGEITEDILSDAIALKPVALVPHPHQTPYRMIAFTEDDAIVLESDDAWSIPKCHDEWR